MTRLSWGNVGERYYEAGVDRGVLYVAGAGVAWNGLVSVDENPTGGEARPFYIDGIKYLNLPAKEEFEATISALYSPVEFDQCDGVGSIASGLFAGQQRRKPFGLSYRTRIGNDIQGNEYGYKIHIVYNALVAPTKKTYSSISDNPELPLLAWAITTTPIAIPNMKHSAHIVIDSSKVSALAIAAVENMLYGTVSTPPALPTPQQLVSLLATADEFVVTDLGGGLFSISGSAENVVEISPGLYEITHETGVEILDPETAEISSP